MNLQMGVLLLLGLLGAEPSFSKEPGKTAAQSNPQEIRYCEDLLLELSAEDHSDPSRLESLLPGHPDAVAVVIDFSESRVGSFIEFETVQGRKVLGDVVVSGPKGIRAVRVIDASGKATGEDLFLRPEEVKGQRATAYYKDPRHIDPALAWMHPANRHAIAVRMKFPLYVGNFVELVFKDGERRVGEIVSFTEQQIFLRRVRASGEVQEVRPIDRSLISEILDIEAFANPSLAKVDYSPEQGVPPSVPVQVSFRDLMSGDFVKFVTDQGVLHEGMILKVNQTGDGGKISIEEWHRIGLGRVKGELAEIPAEQIHRSSLVRFRQVADGRRAWSWLHPFNRISQGHVIGKLEKIEVGQFVSLHRQGAPTGQRHEIIGVVRAIQIQGEGRVQWEVLQVSADGRPGAVTHVSSSEISLSESQYYDVPRARLGSRQ